MNERSVFLAAADIAEPAARAAYLNHACAADPDLRRRVELLLSAADRTGSFMDRPAAPPDATLPFQNPGPTFAPAAPADDTAVLLRRQLRRGVVCFLVVGTIGLVLLLWQATGLADRPGGGSFGVQQYLTLGFEYAVLVWAAVALFARRPAPLARLRLVELAVFASLTLVLSVNQTMLVRAGELARFLPLGGDAVGNRAKGLAISWFSMIVLYGAFIPNTGRRCAAVTGGMAAVAVGGTAWGLSGPAFDPRIAFPALTTLAIWLSFAVVIAIYGAFRIETSRREAAAARRLGPYTLIRKLGAGGMGEVHLAEHLLLKRPCAVKLIRPEKAYDPAAVGRFEREVRAATRLAHPAAVQVYDYGRADDGTFYYVMEYLSGLTLDEVVARTGPLPPARAAFVLVQVCGALAEAHALGMVHRDVKPGNVMLGRLGGRADAAKLLDFGLVSAAGPDDDRLTRAGDVMGTPAYMSPEQARGEPAGPAADVYAVGAVAYFLLTGRPPFAGANALELLHAHRTAPVVPPVAANPEIPADLDAVVVRCLAKDPAHRYLSAAAVAAALGDCAAAWPAAAAAAWWDSADASNPPTPVPL